MLNISQMVMDARKSKDSIKLSVYSEISDRFLKYSKSPEGIKKPLDETIEINLINKIKKEHEETLSYLSAGNENYANEIETIKILNALLPAEASEDEIRNFAETVVVKGNKKEMGAYIKAVKSKFPTADGKLVADIVKELI